MEGVDISRLWEQVAQQDAIEWAGLITGILYVILAAYERPSCWVFGIASSAAIAWKSFTDYMLVADGILQLFYIVIGVAGLIEWLRGRSGTNEKPIVTSSFTSHVVAVIICLLISIPISWLLIQYASARYGYVDTAITFLSVWATILLVRKDLHNWIYWIILDACLVWLYYVSGGYLFSMLFLIYTVIAFWGYMQWKGGNGRGVFGWKKDQSGLGT